MDTNKIEQQAKEDGIERFVVGAVIPNNESILFVRRASDDFKGGIYELPSGKVDEGESLIDSLKRETYEETNLVIDNVIGVVSTFDYQSKSGIKTRQVNFLVSVNNANELKLDPKEHDLSEWVSFGDIESSEILDEMMRPIAIKAAELYKKQ